MLRRCIHCGAPVLARGWVCRSCRRAALTTELLEAGVLFAMVLGCMEASGC